MKHFNYFAIILFLVALKVGAKTDKYRLILTDDPSSTITIAWNQVSGTNPIVKFGTEDHGQNTALYTQTKRVDRTTAFRGMSNQFARLKGLQPNTAYYFVIEDSEGVSKRFWFKTAPSDHTKISFIAGGDSRNNRVPRQNANKLVAKLKPTAVLFGGDMTAYDNDEQWQDWFNDWQLTTASDGRMFPIIPTRGNHERSNTIFELFDTTHEDSYGAITFGGNLFRAYTLNTEISVFGDQLDWLEQDLTSHDDVVFKAAQYHKPMRPHTSGKAEGIDRYNAWARLFYHNAVRLVVECDSHMVKSTYPLKPSSGANNDEGFEVDNKNGTTYVGEGCWGAPLRTPDDEKSWTQDSDSFNQFKWFFVDGDKIELRTVKVDNADEVEELTNDNVFAIPNKLDIWTMKDGESITYIYPTQVLNPPNAAFSDDTKTDFADRNNIELCVNILDKGNGIKDIEFETIKLPEETVTKLTTLTKEPYTLHTALQEDGLYIIRAKINSVDGLNKIIEKKIYVGKFQIEVTILPSVGSDDIEEGQANAGNMYMGSSDLEFGYDSYNEQGYQKVGIRFDDLMIPKRAEIVSSTIEFYGKYDQAEPAQTTIYLENTDNAAAFTSTPYDLTNRDYIAESIVWDIPAWTKKGYGAETQTPDLSALLNQLITQDSWNNHSSVVFKFEPSGPSLENEENKRTAYSRDKYTDAYFLLVTYTYDAAAKLSTTETPQEASSLTYKIYPNPASDKIMIFGMAELVENTTVLGVFNMVGQKMNCSTRRINNSEVEVSVEDLRSGVYFIKVLNHANNQISSHKFIKK